MKFKSFVFASWALVQRDYRVRFRRTLFGYIWFLVPLFSMMFLAMFLGKDLGLYSNHESEIFFIKLLSGLMIWQVFADAWLEPLRFGRRANMLLRSVVFDEKSLLGAGAMSALIAFIIKLPVLILAMIWLDFSLKMTILVFPLILIGVLLAGCTLACFTLPVSLALLDIRYGMPFVQYILFFATPILYPAPDGGVVAIVNNLNPISQIVMPARDAITGNMHNIESIFPALLVSILIFVLALKYYQSKFRLAVAYIGR